MRVIAGRLGGRRLKAPPGRGTRPTADRVREALFSMLGDVSGAVVLDLFAGTGALGIEALSRGARRAVFVERGPGALGALRENLRALGLDANTAEVRPVDAVQAARTALAAAESYDLVFIDPPYSRARDLTQELSAAIPPLLRPGARVVVESDRRSPLVLDLVGDNPVVVQRTRRYGDTSITIHLHDDHS